jgi:hypothetical protein
VIVHVGDRRSESRVRFDLVFGQLGSEPGVQSLWSTSSAAACRTSSSQAGNIWAAVSAAISHCVEAGSAIPKQSCSRLKGRPLPYLSSAIMLAADGSYFSDPTFAGGSR